jgi:long-subunit acyl-CoA synthetase (AMP-forming)
VFLSARTTESFFCTVAYGMTETSPAVTHALKGERKYESVGGPIPNTEMKVVHVETRSSLPARQTGEIYLRGPQVRRESLGISVFPY